MSKISHLVRLFSVAALALSPLASATNVFAHAHLLSSTPADKEMAMPAPKELTLTFSEGLEPKLSKAVVTGPDGKVVKTGDAHLAPGNDKVLLVPLPAPLPDGTYKIDWQAVAKDGHKTTGTFTFESME